MRHPLLSFPHPFTPSLPSLPHSSHFSLSISLRISPSVPRARIKEKKKKERKKRREREGEVTRESYSRFLKHPTPISLTILVPSSSSFHHPYSILFPTSSYPLYPSIRLPHSFPLTLCRLIIIIHSRRVHRGNWNGGGIHLILFHSCHRLSMADA